VEERVGARVILFDQAGRVLLVAVTDPVDARRIWMTPGVAETTVRRTSTVHVVNFGRRLASASRSY
jgi:hypothetical protein